MTEKERERLYLRVRAKAREFALHHGLDESAPEVRDFEVGLLDIIEEHVSGAGWPPARSACDDPPPDGELVLYRDHEGAYGVAFRESLEGAYVWLEPGIGRVDPERWWALPESGE